MTVRVNPLVSGLLRLAFERRHADQKLVRQDSCTTKIIMKTKVYTKKKTMLDKKANEPSVQMSIVSS